MRFQRLLKKYIYIYKSQVAVFYLKYSYGRISLSCKKNEDANILLTSRCTSIAFQEELRAILPVNPASVNFALFSPLGIGIGLDMSSTGGRQTTFLL